MSPIGLAGTPLWCVRRAPRLASVPYDEDGGAGAARGERRLEKRRDKLRRGEVMETLREEFGDQPETVRCVCMFFVVLVVGSVSLSCESSVKTGAGEW